MFRRHRVIVVTPAGRARYLRVLAAHVLNAPLVDEWHLWQNTSDTDDLAWMRELAAMHGKVRLVEPPIEPPNGILSIGQFFRTTISPDAIYVRMDDDLVWLEPGFLERFLPERVEDRDPLFVFPLIINNAVCTWLLQTFDKVRLSVRTHPWCMDFAGYMAGEVAEILHRWFLARIAAGQLDALRFGRITTALCRVSVNCISWFGEDLQTIGGVFPVQDEEEFASVTLPMRLGLVNRITGAAMCAHFAFHPQRERLDATDLLPRYAELAPRLELPR